MFFSKRVQQRLRSGGKRHNTAAPFPSPDYLSDVFFRQPLLFFSSFPQCGAWSQPASLVITFLEPQAPLWTLSDWATITVLAFSSLCSFARVSPLETACRLSKKSLYQANKEGDNMVPYDTSIRRPVPIADT